jgi:hypothetical protein
VIAARTFYGCLAAVSLTMGAGAQALAASPVEERTLIMELMDRYGVVHDFGSPAEFAALFTDDATIVSGGSTVAQGREALLKQAQQDHDKFGTFEGPGGRKSSIMRHVVTNRLVKLTGRNTAEGSSYVITLINDRATGPQVFSMSRYVDRYRKVKGEWRIQHRDIIGESGNPEIARKLFR